MNIVFDLDGTLCTKNTYKIFLILLLLFTSLTLQVKSAFLFFKILVNRKKGIYDRFEMKRMYFFLYEGICGQAVFNGLLHYFLKKFIRKKLILNHARPDDTLILATAAYEFYAARIAKEYNFTTCISTSRQDVLSNTECLGLEKANRLQSFLGGKKIDKFFTDHKDDIPTIKISELTFLVKPSRKSLEEVEILNRKIDYSYV